MYGKHLMVAAIAALCGYGAFQTANPTQPPQSPTQPPAKPPQQQPKSANAEQEIRAAAAEFAAAFSKGDIDRVLSFWADDADYMDDEGVVHRGKAAISKLFMGTSEHVKGHTMTIKVQSVKFTRPDVALEEGIVTVKHPESGSDSNRYMSIWVKNGDRWLLSSVRDQPPVSPADVDDEEPLKEFAWLVGAWNNETSGAKCAMTCKWVLNKQFLEMEYDIKKENEGPTEVAVMLGRHPGSGELRSWFFDSEGGIGGSRWVREGNTWTSESEGVLSDGRTGTSVNSIQFVDDDTFIWRSKNRQIDGNPVADAEVKFTRCKDEPKEAGKEIKQ
jgi:uncharacterized protein (TIGR02246 family)